MSEKKRKNRHLADVKGRKNGRQVKVVCEDLKTLCNTRLFSLLTAKSRVSKGFRKPLKKRNGRFWGRNLAEGRQIALPVESRPRIGLTPRGDIRVADNIEAAVALEQRARHIAQGGVLRLAIGDGIATF